MKREEQIKQAEKEYSSDTLYDGCDYVGEVAKQRAFIASAKWADETMMEKMYGWLESNIDKYAKAVLHSNSDGKLEEKIVLTKSFKEDFMKAMEE